MLLHIDRSLPKPVYRQVIDGIRELADQGTLTAGTALPSTRSLASRLGLDRTTVCRAYEELQALGYLSSRPGSYTRIRKRPKEASSEPRTQSALSWQKLSSPKAREIHEAFLRFAPETAPKSEGAPEPVDLASLDPDPRLYSLKELSRSIRQVLASAGPAPLQYASYQGNQALRESIAQRMRLHGVSVSPEEILITNGAQQGIDLAARLLASAGAEVALEAPSYSIAIPLFKFHGLKLRAVPMTPHGMDLDVLGRVLKTDRTAFVYAIPNFQNPTGITTSSEHRERLLELCLERKVPLVEDGFEEDMKYFGKVALPVKALDKHNIVLYIGTFSKALFPGLRLGWIAADKDCIRRITAIKRFSDLSSGNFVQAVIDHFVRHGYYDLHLRRLHREYRKRLTVLLKALEADLPQGVTWTRPVGGYTLWVRLPFGIAESRLKAHLAAYGVSVSPGGYYFPDGRGDEHFRLSIARLDEDEIREGVARLGKALRALVHTRTRR